MSSISSVLTDMKNKLSGIMPNEQTRLDILNEVCKTTAVYAITTFFTWSVVLAHTAYPSTLFRVVSLACYPFWEKAQKTLMPTVRKPTGIVLTAQRCTAAVLALELAASMLFPASASGRLIVQGVTVTVSAISNANVIRGGIAFLKESTKFRALEKKTLFIAIGIFAASIGTYGSVQTYRVAASLLR